MRWLAWMLVLLLPGCAITKIEIKYDHGDDQYAVAMELADKELR